MMTFKELREQSGMNMKQFAAHFEIPYRTVQNWEAGVNKCPEYLLKLMKFKLDHAIVFPCNVGDTVYGQFGNYGKKIHECTVVKSKLCQFRDRTLHNFLDVEFDIIDPYYRDGRLMRCMQQAVFDEDFGSWDRVYRTREEAEAALARMKG